MNQRELCRELCLKLHEPDGLNAEAQTQLNELLATSEGRELWVRELSFQADLIDLLQTKKAMPENFAAVAQAEPIKPTPLVRAPVPTMPKALRFSSFLALAALLMVALFMSYYINGIPTKTGHTTLGQIVSVNGVVHLNRGPLNVDLFAGMMFKEGDKLITGQNGSALFKYDDGSIIAIGANSDFAFATQSQQKRDGWDIGLSKGVLDADIRPQTKALRFKTSALGVEVLGTQFSIHANVANQSVELYEGKVRVHANEKTNDLHLLTPGQGFGKDLSNQQSELFTLPKSDWEEVTVESTDAKSQTLVVSSELGTRTLRWAKASPQLTSTKEVLNLDFVNFKVGQKLKLKLQGLACPQILEVVPIHSSLESTK